MFQEIISKIQGKQVILFGEIHGTKEIPELLSWFFEEFSKKETFNLCLEMPDEFQDQLDSYIVSGDSKKLEKITFFSKKNCADGRNSLEYLNLIKKISRIKSNDKKIKIFFIFPSSAKNQEDAEQKMADKVLVMCEDKKTFVVMGEIHASKKEINFPQNKILPAGFLIHKKLKNKMYSILLKSERGRYFNNGIREIVSCEKDSFEKNFDHIIKLEKVSPCSFL